MKPKILIIDDSADFRAQVNDYLKMHDLDVETFEAGTAEMGVAKASCVRPDIVLMDIHLPHGNGLDAVRHIKAQNPDCDVIVLTMLDVEAFRQAAQNVAVTDFIGKSEIYERLMPSIEQCLKTEKTAKGGGNHGKK